LVPELAMNRPLTRRIGLVGCVSQKRSVTTRAEDLYVSTLFVGRRRFVETSCDDWYILSAKHGLVRRSTELAPYDVALTGKSRFIRRSWAAGVVEQIEREIQHLHSVTFEIHAGADYFDFGLATGLEQLGAHVETPTRGLRQGQQLRFYRDHGAREQ
jgi:hypothetical protein